MNDLLLQRELTGRKITRRAHQDLLNAPYPHRANWKVYYNEPGYRCHYCEKETQEYGLVVGFGFGGCISCFKMFYTEGSIYGSYLFYHAHRAKYTHYEDGSIYPHIGAWDRQLMKERYNFFNFEDE